MCVSSPVPRHLTDAIDRVVPKATHGDQYDALTAVLNRPGVQSPGAAPAATPTAPVTGGKRGGSTGKTAAPSEDEMSKWSESKRKRWKGWLDTRDAKVQTFGAADYDDYVATMLVSGGSVFGRGIPSSNPVHPLFLDRLEAASSKARAAIGSSCISTTTIGTPTTLRMGRPTPRPSEARGGVDRGPPWEPEIVVPALP
jgi:hypothetical protein